ncbi:glycosyltransferase [uncultured Clostridium sp.]|uniref:glycosyltransferase n=1 Tax=Clostridium sp. TaxID=1506 RepID=UPI0026701C48|nr:glycosyltransferase [uncultured Clostridium sp.]
MKLAIIGQKGIPSRAGGVEIHVEEIASRLACYGENVTVYCRESYCEEKYDKYKGINIKYIPSINTKHLDAITYTFLATIDAIKSKSDIIHYHALV